MAIEFTRKDIQDARRALAKCQEYEMEAEKATALGLDCSETNEVCGAVKPFLEKFLEIYGHQFPERK